jgi:hypothetical protein
MPGPMTTDGWIGDIPLVDIQHRLQVLIASKWPQRLHQPMLRSNQESVAQSSEGRITRRWEY